MSARLVELLTDFVIAAFELGLPISVDLEAKLIAEGIDVEGLRAKHGN
jgi:hypothetical protein